MSAADEYFDAIVVGAGWAGLSVSAKLQTAGIKHLVLERRRVAETWRTQRWNSFRMNTPNIQTVMPGDRYQGNDPEGFISRDAFVALLEEFARRKSLPVRTATDVRKVTPAARGRFRVETTDGALSASHVVVATGNLNVPKRPRGAGRLPKEVSQIDAPDYREPSQFEPGAVLVIGCGNSGGQIAEDLMRAGRKVFLATGHNGRMPRRYRGRDITLWLADSGLFDLRREDFVGTENSLPGRPLLGAGHTISLQSLSAQGAVLLGRFSGVDHEGRLLFHDDVLENVRYGDESSARIKLEIDRYIERDKVSAPAAESDPAEVITGTFPDPPIQSVNAVESKIAAVIWCTGFVGDFGWLQVPGTLNTDGQPLAGNAMSAANVHFVGLDFAETRKSGTILVADEESERVAASIVGRLREPQVDQHGASASGAA